MLSSRRLSGDSLRARVPGKPRKEGDGAMQPEEGVRRYVVRECGRCIEGEIHAGSPTELRKEPCPSCGGTGRITAFLYPKPKGLRGEWPPRTIARKDVP